MLPIFAERASSIVEEDRADSNLRLLHHRRMIRQESRPFDLPQERFIELFRLNKELCLTLIQMVEPYLQDPVLTLRKVSKDIIVLAALRFYATGAYQRTIGQDLNLGLSQTSVHRCIHKVTDIIDEHLAKLFIKFPNTSRKRQEIKVEFMNKYGFPGVVGAVDGTHIAILKPEVEEHNFINRKGFHSLNVQVVSDESLKILSLNTNYGGSTNDSFIWRNSQIHRYMRHIYENGESNTWLIGDSGYPLQPYLMVPYLNPQLNTLQQAFNKSHSLARNVVERCIGLMKMRFRCLLKERVARYEPKFVAKLTTVCAVLHNMCVEENVPLFGDANVPLVEEGRNHEDDHVVNNRNMLQEGQAVRQCITSLYFSN
nr:unnamed protein product [Callosobruchus analis]